MGISFWQRKEHHKDQEQRKPKWLPDSPLPWCTYSETAACAPNCWLPQIWLAVCLWVVTTLRGYSLVVGERRKDFRVGICSHYHIKTSGTACGLKVCWLWVKELAGHTCSATYHPDKSMSVSHKAEEWGRLALWLRGCTWLHQMWVWPTTGHFISLWPTS